MTTSVRLPSAFWDLTGGRRDVDLQGATVKDLIDSMEDQFPGAAGLLLDDSGLRRYVNVFVGGTDVRYLSGLATAVPDGADVTILPAIAGG